MNRAALVFLVVAACGSAARNPPAETALFNAHVEGPPAPATVFVHNLLERRLGSEVPIAASPDGVIGFDVRARTQLGEARRKLPDVKIDAAANLVSLPANTRTRVAMLRTGAAQPIEASARDASSILYCIDESGRVTWASGPGIEPRVLDIVRSWRFAPYFVDGKPIRACSEVDVFVRGHK
jgi:hypothetical protein